MHQPVAKPILHTKFHQNRTMGCEIILGLSFTESKGSNPFNGKHVATTAVLIVFDLLHATLHYFLKDILENRTSIINMLCFNMC